MTESNSSRSARTSDAAPASIVDIEGVSDRRATFALDAWAKEGVEGGGVGWRMGWQG